MSHARTFDRLCWLHVLLSMLTQLGGELSFPSYNVALGFWGSYAALAGTGRGVLGYVAFTIVSAVLDIAFISLWMAENDLAKAHESTEAFCKAMFVVNLVAKLPSLYYAQKVFAQLGGLYALSEPHPGDGRSSLGSDYSLQSEGGAGEWSPPSLGSRGASGAYEAV